jgi:hypothetical protein
MKIEDIDDMTPFSDNDDEEDNYIPLSQNEKVLSQYDQQIMEEENEEGAGYMEQEEIVIKKGKKLKQQKLIKLRDYDIQQPDYCVTPGATLVYH